MYIPKILPAQRIREFINDGELVTDISYVQPCSLDVTLKLDKPIIIPKAHLFECELNVDISLIKKYYPRIDIRYSSRSTIARNGINIYYNSLTNTVRIRPLAYNIKLEPNQRIGQFYFAEHGDGEIYQPINLTLNKVYEVPKYHNSNNYSTIVEPNKFYLGASTEEIEIPNDKVGFIEEYVPEFGYYFSHLNAGFIDSGFKGKIVFEILSAETIKLENKPFARLTLMDLTEETDTPYNGNYQNQSSLKSIKPKEILYYNTNGVISL